MASRAVCLEAGRSSPVQEGFGEDGARRVAGTKKKDVALHDSSRYLKLGKYRFAAKRTFLRCGRAVAPCRRLALSFGVANATPPVKIPCSQRALVRGSSAAGSCSFRRYAKKSSPSIQLRHEGPTTIPRPAGFTARTNALINLPSIIGATFSASSPAC